MPGFADLAVATWYYANLRSWAIFLVKANLRVTVEGAENIPRKGPFILASNHLSLADPPVLCVKTPRRIAWMAKKELFDHPLFGIFYRFYGCVPVKRGAVDRTALRRSEQVLEKGLVLGMFPEGTRSRAPGLREAEPGTALIALRSGAPVLPVGIAGGERVTLPRAFFNWATRSRPDLRVSYGKPFVLEHSGRIQREDVERGTQEIMRHIAELLPPEYQGIYAGSAETAKPVQS